MFFLACLAQGVCHIHFLRAQRAGLPPELGCHGFEPCWCLEYSCLWWPFLGSLMMSKPNPA